MKLQNILVILLTWIPLSASINLENASQDFVLESRQIKLKKYPLAFNPSIVRWKGELWMSFRFHPNTRAVGITSAGLIKLNESLEPIGKPYVLYCLDRSDAITHTVEDVRLFVSDDRLYAIYNDHQEPTSLYLRRVCCAELDFDGRKFLCKNFDIFLEFEGASSQKDEKSWTPFEYGSSILFSYIVQPHRIMNPLFGTGRCETIYNSQGNIVWNWGELRGGTPALLIDDEYLAFFHSRSVIETEHSYDEPMIHYFMGAYTFSSQPPFHITRISSEPIVDKGFYASQRSYWWGPRIVVFPCGYIADENYIWLFFGKKDKEMWITKLDRKKLMESLVSVETIHD